MHYDIIPYISTSELYVKTDGLSSKSCLPADDVFDGIVLTIYCILIILFPNYNRDVTVSFSIILHD